MHLGAVVPIHTIADGEYDDLAPGRLAALGFALQVLSSTPSDGAPQVGQEGAPIPSTTVTGTIVLPGDEVPPILDAGSVRPLLATVDETWPAGERFAVTGRLVVEPYLWATDGMLWPLVPEGVQMWSVDTIRRVGDDGIEDLPALPGPSGLDHGATYLLDLVGG